MKIPKFQKSTDLSNGIPFICSGDRYSWVPTKDVSNSVPFKCLVKLKSKSFIYPSSSTRIFSGLISLKLYP
jgi:hypothetical protein